MGSAARSCSSKRPVYGWTPMSTCATACEIPPEWRSPATRVSLPFAARSTSVAPSWRRHRHNRSPRRRGTNRSRSACSEDSGAADAAPARGGGTCLPHPAIARYKLQVPPERSYARKDLPAELLAALDHAIDKRARRPVALRVTEVAGYTDWVLLLSARSDRQVRAITEAVMEGIASTGRRPVGSDGLSDYNWVLLDYDDFIVHVFYHPVRSFYDLESMWHDAPRVELGCDAETMDTSDLEGLDAPDPMPEFRGNIEFGGFADEFNEAPADIDEDRLAAASEAARQTLTPDDGLFDE
ncbi:MAG: ribosome silencing factor [Myxococcales bacterium FL481]|nr:MAG: ribosome silencing factor [Myxococcales bacterium FL481]